MKKPTKKLTTQEFIEKSEKIHLQKYDYSKSVYKNSKTKLIIRCLNHGDFLQRPNDHLSGYGCKHCAIDENIKRHTYTKDEFISMANLKHNNKYDYSKIEYKNLKTKIIIICPIHGDFLTSPSVHLRTLGCRKCSNKIAGLNIRMTQDEFEKAANEKHNNKYDYSLSIYEKSDLKIDIICPKHGVFKQAPGIHICGNGCPNCVISKGENEILSFLNYKNIKFEPQKKFNDCKNIRKLPFDFYLPDYNLCIEYQGAQHYSSYHHLGGEEGFEKTINNDIIKKKFCLKNNINFLEIKYNEDTIEKLENYLRNKFSVVNNDLV